MFTRAQLLQEVWGYDFFGGTRTVDVHVRRLRAKLGSEHESLIGTVRNVGYKAVRPTRGRGAGSGAASDYPVDDDIADDDIADDGLSDSDIAENADLDDDLDGGDVNEDARSAGDSFDASGFGEEFSASGS